MAPWWFGAGLLAVTLLALGLRAWRLVALGGFDFDEVATVYIAQRSPADLLAYVRSAPFEHPPLYYLLAHAWLGLGRDETTLRVLSVLLGGLTVPLLGLLGARVFGRAAGLAAALLLALAPAHLFFSRDARMYPLLTLLCLLGTYALVRACQGGGAGRRGWWALWLLSGLAALATHYFAACFLLGQGLWLAWTRRRQGGLRLALGAAVLAGALAGLWLALAPGLRHSLGALRLAVPPPSELTTTLGAALAGLLRGPLSEDPTPADDLTAALCALLLAASLLALVASRRPGRGLPLLCGALPLLLLGLLALLGREVPVRYLLPALPLLLLGLVGGWQAAARGPRRWPVVLAVWATLTLPWLAWYYGSYQRGDYAEALRAVEERAAPGELAVLNGPWQQLLWDHYSSGLLPARILTGAVPLVEGQVATALADVTRGQRAVWLFEADPGRADPDGFVGRWLARYAYRDETWSYRQVQVTRYLLDDATLLPARALALPAPGVELVSARVDPSAVGPGQTGRLELVWRVGADFDPGLKASVRLWAGDGYRWWRADPWLLDGWLAARPPQEGDLLYTRLAYSLPDALPAPPYELEALLYRSTDRPESGAGWVAWTAPSLRVPLVPSTELAASTAPPP